MDDIPRGQNGPAVGYDDRRTQRYGANQYGDSDQLLCAFEETLHRFSQCLQPSDMVRADSQMQWNMTYRLCSPTYEGPEPKTDGHYYMQIVPSVQTDVAIITTVSIYPPNGLDPQSLSEEDSSRIQRKLREQARGGARAATAHLLQKIIDTYRMEGVQFSIFEVRMVQEAYTFDEEQALLHITFGIGIQIKQQFVNGHEL